MFVLTATAIALSGTLAPGPITVATLSAGARNRHAGILIGFGHVTIELFLLIILICGAGTFLHMSETRIAIGFIGGIVLLLMGIQLLMSLGKPDTAQPAPAQRHPFWTGIVLSGANPYFLIWWVTVGFTFITQGLEFGALALVLFVACHWISDLGWLELLSLAGFKGTEVMSKRNQKIVLIICALAMLGFGAKFIADAGRWTFGN
jgi:threonine/homoserine/homoserine lactone efflux protein